MGACLASLFISVHDQLLCLTQIEGEVVVLAPHCQVTDVLPIGCLIIVGDQAYHCCVISKLNDGVWPHGGEQGVQVGTKHTPLRGPRVEDQSGGGVVAYPYHQEAACQDVQDPVAEGGV